MKIGIITHWNAKDNYGGILQTYALQRYLRNLGHEAYVIRFIRARKKANIVSSFRRCLSQIKHFILNNEEQRKKHKQQQEWLESRCFDVFRGKYISLSKRIYRNLQDIRATPPQADLYITGSDQVWAGDLTNPNEWIFYLAFGDNKVKRISYAASFGFSYFPGKDEEKFKELLSDFNAISVREANGIDICQKYGFDATRCVDSTFLLKKEQYTSIMSPRKHNEAYAFFYTVNVSTPDEIYWNDLREYLLSQGKKCVVTTGTGYKHAEEIFNNAIYDYATVEEWISNIYYSDVVITASFHGIAFSLILNKDFIYLPLKGIAGGGNNRIVDLLSLVGLEKRQAKSFKEVKELMNEKIDYNHINNRQFQQLLNQSKTYLGAFLG